jgi:sulfur-oxidizing protein SoxX
LIACALQCIALGAYGAGEEARTIISDAGRGNCVVCHFIPGAGVPSNAFGNLGPSLADVGLRLSPAQIKARIVDPRVLSPDTVMPPYGSTVGLFRVQSGYRGKPILTQAEIDTVVAYLSTLK